jgi:hypothetical protein
MIERASEIEYDYSSTANFHELNGNLMPVFSLQNLEQGFQITEGKVLFTT